MTHGYELNPPSPNPGSPPGMTTSRSSKSSSFQSLNGDDGSVLADTSHFEDIGLDDDNVTLKATPRAPIRRDPSPNTLAPRSLAGARPGPRPRQSFPNLRSHSMTSNPRSTSVAALSDPRTLSLPRISTGSRSTTSLPLPRRHRSPSPGLASPGLGLTPRDPSIAHRPRRGSWQANRDRRSTSELENECDEDDGDDIPDGLVLDNVPISPRPQIERPPSRAPSVSPSPDRAPKERVRSVGNGTPPVAQAQGSLRSPTWKTDGLSPLSDSYKPRAQSWNAVHAGLSAEAKALTQKLEEHADEADHDLTVRSPGAARPNTWNSAQPSMDRIYDKKERVKSSTPELPPLRRTNIMIDPLPVSKEKEAVLSRTRPSWLPPKDPAEERKHLKEYQKLMAASIKAEERRDAAKKQQMEIKDHTADDLMKMWEKTIMPRWDIAIQERSTRELWWQGIPPRSRGSVWTRALGNTLGLSPSSFHAALERAQSLETRVKEDRASPEDIRRARWLEQLRDDARNKTWPALRIFGEEGPLHQNLVDVLKAYTMYRSDIGYMPGCNTVAALLLLNLDGPASTFVALANALNRPLPLAFFASDYGAQTGVYDLIIRTLAHKSPSLHEHLTKTLSGVSPDRYLNNMLTSLFTSVLAIDEASRLWDVYVFEGDTALVRAAVACLLNNEMALLGTSTEDEVRSILTGKAASDAGLEGIAASETVDHFIRSMREAGKE